MGNVSYENHYDFPIDYSNQINQGENEHFYNFNIDNEYKYNFNGNDIFQEEKKIEEEVKDIFLNKKDNIENSNDEINNDIVSQTLYISTSVSDSQKEKKKYFEIKNINKLGRKRKNKKSKPTNNDRTRPDNAENKLLTMFSNSTLSYINSKLFKNINRKKMIQRIEPLSKKYRNSGQRKKLLLKTMGEIYSAPVSERNSTYNKNHNKKLIENLRKNNKNVEIESLLDKTFGEMYQIYKSNTIPEYSLEKDLSLIETDDEDYNALLKYKAIHFIEAINNKQERERLKK